MTPGRRAGVGRLADGRTIAWSVADGRRGRRWRTATSDEHCSLEAALLLELAPDGRLSKVELATSKGLLTLHPEAGLLHGNVVAAAGVRHLRFGWSADHVLVIEGSAVSLAAAALQAAPGRVGERQVAPAIIVRSDLGVEANEVAFGRPSGRTLRVELDAETRELELDDDGIPDELRSGGDWPLELD